MIGAITLRMSAEKSTNYTAPPYLVRFGRSVVFLGITGMSVAAILFFVQLWLSHGLVARTGRVIFWQTTGALILVAAMLAATDDMNDERWNPAHTGSFILTILLPLAVLLLRQSRANATAWFVAIGLVPFFFILLRWLLFSIQSIGFDMSW